MKQYVGISRDHSRSMWNITTPAKQDYNDNIISIREAANLNNLDTVVSVVKCGVGPYARVDREVVNTNINTLRPLSSYVADGSGTPLWDSVGELIDVLSDVPDAADPEVSFLVMVITDGEENVSKKWNSGRLSEKIRELQASDRWTFVFRVPRGYGARLVNRLGIHEGNVLEWDQTARGVETASVATNTAMASYFTNRSQGIKSTSKFYADLSQVSLKEVKQTLHDISNQVVTYSVLPLDHGVAIKSYIERHTPYPIGCAFYQLTKTEKVQEAKQICIRDRMTKAIYTGQSARDLLGLPHYGAITLAPHKLGDYDVFVQSTSVNRKLVGGTLLLYMRP